MGRAYVRCVRCVLCISFTSEPLGCSFSLRFDLRASVFRKTARVYQVKCPDWSSDPSASIATLARDPQLPGGYSQQIHEAAAIVLQRAFSVPNLAEGEYISC